MQLKVFQILVTNVPAPPNSFTMNMLVDWGYLPKRDASVNLEVFQRQILELVKHAVLENTLL